MSIRFGQVSRNTEFNTTKGSIEEIYNQFIVRLFCESTTYFRFAECMVLLSMAAADYLFFTCCTYIRIQFRLLQYDFERIIPDRSISKGERYDETEFRDKFKELVEWHQDLIR